jgi:23S rRNA pseudouridine2457 synthase
MERYINQRGESERSFEKSSEPSDRFLLFHKPYDVLSQFTDERSPTPHRTLKDYISVSDVYPVGRLDRDSEGLLLLTNNGRVQHRLTDPKFRHPRTYWVQVERIPDTAALQQLRQGIAIQDYRTRPATVRLLETEPDLPPRDPPIRFRKSVPTAWLELILTEGRNRQVRRMTAAVGFPTLRLVRVAIAHLCLEDLPPGEWRELTASEYKSLLQL